ncbi:MAG: Bug family tripartite tricarboxylate transporter substrate binding protein [Xanthobacteraceae bacterium]
MSNRAPTMPSVWQRLLLAFTLLGALAALPGHVIAQGVYPSPPIRIIVPLPPGATADTLPRIIGEKLTLKWGQPVVIENRPGAAQNLGAEVVAKSEPDGYTLLATPQGPLVISQSLYPKLGFDPTAFVPITVLAHLPYVLVAHPSLQASTLDEFIALARGNPGKLNYASPGTGSSNQLAMEWLKSLAGLPLTHVPYKGAAPALTDLLAGHVDIMFDNAGNVVQLIRDGRLKALAVSSRTRMPELPAVPAIAESFPEFVATSWFGLVAPPKTPPEIAALLSQAIAEILKLPDVASRVRELTATPVGSTPAETASFFKEESERWRRVIVTVGVKPE